MFAVETPPVRVELELGRRRHRRLTTPSGLLLFLCMFLPLVRGCDDHTPIYPLELPMFVPPYLFGLLVAAAGWAATVRGLRRALGGLRVVSVMSFAASGFVALVRPGLGLVCGIATGAMLATLGWHGVSERRLAGATVLLGASGTLWFGLCATSDDALSGVYVALAASLGLLAGGLVWLFEAPPAFASARRPGLSS